MIDLPVMWFVLIAVLLAGYAVLDGFDLGVGILHLIVAREGDERTVAMGSIVPIWDGNEVWLLTAGGALFAAFPLVYATVFSGFYLALILVLLALIFRAVSLEMRGHDPSPVWQRRWDRVFAVSSALAALLLGVAIGNVLEGVPLGDDGTYRGGLIGLLRPMPLLVGALTVAMFAMQGGAWLALKTSGELRARSRRASAISAGTFGVLWVAVTLVSWDVTHLHDLPLVPATYLVPILIAAAILGAAACSARGSDGWAFVASSAAIALLVALGGLALFPEILPATDPARSIAIRDAASSELTLRTMFVVALIGMPLVIAYTLYVYLRFRNVSGARY